MATRNDEWRSEVTDLLFDAEHRDELRRVGVWAFEHIAKTEATGQIAAVLNAVAGRLNGMAMETRGRRSCEQRRVAEPGHCGFSPAGRN